MENNQYIIKLILDLCRTMAKLGIAFRGTYRGSNSEENGNFTQLLALISRYCPRLQHWLEDKDKRAYKVTYTSPHSQKKFLGLLGDEIRNKITEEINSADAFTIMADTTPETSHKDQMSVIMRYVNDNGVVCKRLVDLKEVRDKTGAGQAAAVIASVDQNGMDKDRIAFQS